MKWIIYSYNTVGDLHCVHIPWSKLCPNWIKKRMIGTFSASLQPEENFSLIFGWKYYLKTSLWENLFQDFFLFLLLREIFSLTLGWKYYLKTSLWENLFQDFFSLSSTGRIFTLILGRNFYLKDFNMHEGYSSFSFSFNWVSFTLSLSLRWDFWVWKFQTRHFSGVIYASSLFKSGKLGEYLHGIYLCPCGLFFRMFSIFYRHAFPMSL